MSEVTGISWCDSTFNPWIGCTRVSTAAGGGGGCDNCYAAVSAPARIMHIAWGPGEPRRRTSAGNWKQPLAWESKHAEFQRQHGRRRRVFCASLADVFDNEVPTEWRDDLWRLIEATPHLDWLLLTKRIGNVQHMVWPKWMQAGFPTNVWIGATIVNQTEADRDIQKLLRLPASVRFLSMEPLLGPVDLTRIVLHSGPIELAPTAPPEWQNVKTVNVVIDATKPGKQSGRRALDWIIVGGESGHQARRFDIEWPREIVQQCREAGVPVFVKQLGAHTTWNGMQGPGTRWPRETGSFDTGSGHFRKHLIDRAGADMNEWPEDLRVQEWPETDR